MALFPGALPAAGTASSTATLAAAGHTSLHNTVDDEARAIATKIGTGAATPSNNTVMRGNGAGTSTWGQAVLTTDVTGTLPVANGGTGAITAADARSNLGVATALETLALAYPVGSIYVNATNSTNPGTLLGFGTWTAFGAGRVMVGFDSGQTEFDTAEETGGEKTHTLTTDEMPAHTHTETYGDNVGGVTTLTAAGSTSGNATSSNTTLSTGGGSAHNNLQPYITVYFWKRTA